MLIRVHEHWSLIQSVYACTRREHLHGLPVLLVHQGRLCKGANHGRVRALCCKILTLWRLLLISCCRSTSNETVVSGSNITAALHRSFPQLTSGDLAEFETVYNISQFSSEQEQVLTATGEVSVRCGVSELFAR